MTIAAFASTEAFVGLDLLTRRRQATTQPNELRRAALRPSIGYCQLLVYGQRESCGVSETSSRCGHGHCGRTGRNTWSLLARAATDGHQQDRQ